MALPGIHQTPQKDAARRIWKGAEAQAFSTASQLIDIHRLARALCDRSVSGLCSSKFDGKFMPGLEIGSGKTRVT